jgi:hypothetical protein
MRQSVSPGVYVEIPSLSFEASFVSAVSTGRAQQNTSTSESSNKGLNTKPQILLTRLITSCNRTLRCSPFHTKSDAAREVCDQRHRFS